MPDRHNFACYISDHGFGHAVRSAEVIAELASRRPEWRFFIISKRPAFLFQKLLASPNVFLRREAVDIGLIQKSPRSIDFQATEETLEHLVSDFGVILEREQRFLKRECISAVYSDLPFIVFEAAHRQGLPAFGVGNFSWDWIYDYYKDRSPIFAQAARLARNCYSKATLYLRLPESPPALAFPEVRDIPLITRFPDRSREKVRQSLDIPEGTQCVLIAFSELSLSREAQKRLESADDLLFLVPAPLKLDLENALPIDTSIYPFPELVAAADVIVTKAGYGIVADAIISGTPLVTTERDDFPELPYLNALIDRSTGQEFLDRETFEEGNWLPAIYRARRRFFSLPTDGAFQAAEEIQTRLQSIYENTE